METKKDDLWSKSMLLMLALLSLLIIALCSCTTSKPMVYERTIVRTDTVIKADTMWHNRFVENIVDSVSKQFSSVKDSVATVVDEQGNVKKHEAWHWRENSTQTSTERIDNGDPCVRVFFRKLLCGDLFASAASAQSRRKPDVDDVFPFFNNRFK